MTRPPDIIAIDGGGTRCRVSCEIAGQRHTYESGSCNVTSDMDGAAQQILDGLDGLAEVISLDASKLHSVPAYLGLAGVTGPSKASEVAGRLPFSQVRIEEDRVAAARGALGLGNGALIHCGTGSFQVVQTDGHPRFAGGWGARLGDEASAQWVGRMALSATLNAQDQLTPHTDLTTALLAQFGGTTGIVEFAAKASASDLGTIAPDVTAAGEAGDAIARTILEDGANWLTFAIKRLGWAAPMPITFTGGIAPCYARYFHEDLQDVLAPAFGTPLDGAIALAYDFKKELMG